MTVIRDRRRQVDTSAKDPLLSRSDDFRRSSLPRLSQPIVNIDELRGAACEPEWYDRISDRDEIIELGVVRRRNGDDGEHAAVSAARGRSLQWSNQRTRHVADQQLVPLFRAVGGT